MLSAERASVNGINRQHLEQEARIRSSIVQAATVPYDIYDGRRRSSQFNSSKVILDKFSKYSGSSHSKHMFKGIHKFEIILEKRKKPEEIEKALSVFRKDSLDSIRRGSAKPSIRNYVDIDADAYEPGETVAGHVLLMLSHKMLITDIQSKLKGIYIVAYEQKVEGESTTHTEQITFLEVEANLATQKADDGNKEVQPGTYHYDFSFKLPLNIPGTMFYERFQTVYEGASIVYSIEAVMNIETSNHQVVHSPVAKEILQVIRRVPERMDNIYHKFHKISKISNVGFCCYDMGKIALKVSLPKLIYMEGDIVILGISLSNESTLKIEEIDIALVQYSSFKNKTQSGYVLRARNTLLSHNQSMKNMGMCDIDQQIALSLPDEMQPSTMVNIVPPTSHHKLLYSKSSQSKPKVEIEEEITDASSTETPGKHVGFKVPNEDQEEEQEEDDDEEEKLNYILLETDYHKLFEIAYYIQVKVRSSSEWFNMKGPEIHFPITIEKIDSETLMKKNKPHEIDDIDLEEDEEDDDNHLNVPA